MKSSYVVVLLLVICSSVAAQSVYIPSGTGGIGNNTTTVNVGIGTALPQSVLHLKSLGVSTYLTIEKISSSYEGGLQFRKNGNIDFFLFSDDSNDALKLQAGSLAGEADATPRMEFPVSNRNLYMALSGGNVGIGTRSVTGYRLAVEGKIGAREVNVNTSTWADYVFADDYKLPSLETIERYIKQYRHLPEVPSAQEVEENGVDLGSMNALLLKKIEELTLYVIDMKKQNDQLKAEIEEIKTTIGNK